MVNTQISGTYSVRERHILFLLQGKVRTYISKLIIFDFFIKCEFPRMYGLLLIAYANFYLCNDCI